MQKIQKFLFSPAFMGALLMIFAVSMAAATFIGNDYGSSAAYSFVYGAKWFELIFLLLSVNLIGQMIIYKLYRKTKITIMIFHLAFVLMIAGAAITRYTGWEGSIHIREGEDQNTCFSSEKYIEFAVKDRDGKVLKQNYKKFSMASSSAGNYEKNLKINGQDYKLILSEILPNASKIVSDDPEGEPMISLMVMDSTGRETVNFKKGEIKTCDGVSIGFDPPEETDMKITAGSGSFFIESKYPFSQMSMMTKEAKTNAAGERVELKSMQLIKVDNIRIVSQEMTMKGVLKPVSVSMEMQETGKNAFIFNLLSKNEKASTLYLWDNGSVNKTSASVEIDGEKLEVSYGPKETVLPFSLKLNDFVLERYPGSNSPSGYRSNVLLSDKTAHVERPFVIFMNKILKYKGYRFYQSSYDSDEKGTILSVNHDPAGIFVTYTGYIFLFLFIILSLLNRNSFCNNVKAVHWSSALRKAVPAMLILFFLSGFNNVKAQKLIADKAVAEEFGKVLVQDQKGRTKPLFTLSNDILRKVTRGNSYEGLTSMQVFLGIYLDFDNWKDVPLIKVSNKELQNNLGLSGNMAAFSDLIDLKKGGASYKLTEDVNKVYSKSPSARTKEDKEIMKVDERVNIIYMIYTGGFVKIFPLRDGTHSWGSPQDALRSALNKEDSLYLENVIPMFTKSLQENNTATAMQTLKSIGEYQKKFAKYDLPPESRTKAEILYYKMMIFERLFPYYFAIGLIMLVSLIIMVIRGRKNTSVLVKILGWLLFAGFLFHTFGLALRWYIAGHSPMSNGYESMIFISWVTLLAGFIFSRRSKFALSATAVLGAMTLMVAHLSFMDPEITNLVPVLKSYWLTLHVSVITGSYGFLGLGAILGLIVMILLSLSNDRNRERISDTIDELTVINFKTLSLGLYFLTIGTFLGAVWANESWGNYWGWDPKETWSLITIVVYSLTTHSRMIPGMKDVFSFNLLSLFAFSSVLMTYFGVNYYLSGLHSYAAGEPFAVPAFVYITVIIIAGIAFLAYTKYRRFEKIQNPKISMEDA